MIVLGGCGRRPVWKNAPGSQTLPCPFFFARVLTRRQRLLLMRMVMPLLLSRSRVRPEGGGGGEGGGEGRAALEVEVPASASLDCLRLTLPLSIGPSTARLVVVACCCCCCLTLGLPSSTVTCLWREGGGREAVLNNGFGGGITETRPPRPRDDGLIDKLAVVPVFPSQASWWAWV